MRGDDEDYTMSTKGRLVDRLRVILAGRAAEEVTSPSTCPPGLIHCRLSLAPAGFHRHQRSFQPHFGSAHGNAPRKVCLHWGKEMDPQLNRDSFLSNNNAQSRQMHLMHHSNARC